MNEDRIVRWAAMATALLTGALVAARDPGVSLFERLTRSGGISGPVLQPMSLLWTALWVFFALVIAYVIVSLAVRTILAGRA